MWAHPVQQLTVAVYLIEFTVWEKLRAKQVRVEFVWAWISSHILNAVIILSYLGIYGQGLQQATQSLSLAGKEGWESGSKYENLSSDF